MRKRKVTYPVAKTSRRGPTLPGGEPSVRPTVASIDLTAATGRAGITVGSRVRILGSGLDSGEIAIVETEPRGVIPAAHVRTEAGRRRLVRTIDLEPVTDDR